MDHQSASMDQDREDAVFKMLMMSFAELEGKRLLEENERLKDDRPEMPRIDYANVRIRCLAHDYQCLQSI